MTTPHTFRSPSLQPPEATDPAMVRTARDRVAEDAAEGNMVAAALMEKTLKEERYQTLLQGMDDDEC